MQLKPVLPDPHKPSGLPAIGRAALIQWRPPLQNFSFGCADKTLALVAKHILQCPVPYPYVRLLWQQKERGVGLRPLWLADPTWFFAWLFSSQDIEHWHGVHHMMSSHLAIKSSRNCRARFIALKVLPRFHAFVVGGLVAVCSVSWSCAITKRAQPKGLVTEIMRTGNPMKRDITWFNVV